MRDVAEDSPRAVPTRHRRRAAFGFIFATAVMNAVSFGIMIPILPNLIKQFVGGDTAAASEWNVLFATTWGLAQFFCGPLLGMLSDRFGRRPVLLISLFGLFVDFLFMAFAPTLMWLFVGRVLNGITASSFSTANAYVADITAPERRARRFGMIGAAFSFGFLIGPALGGLAGEHDLRLPFKIAAALTAVNWVYGLLILPESLASERRAAAMQWRRANPLGALLFLKAHGEVLALATINFLYQLAQVVLPTIFVLYTGYRYGWTPQIMGFTMMATGVAGVVVQMLLVGPVVGRIGERGAVLLGASAGIAGFINYALAPNGAVYLAAVPVFAGMGFLGPGLMGLMSRRVEPGRQGQLQGANQSLQGVASVIGPPLFGLTFAWAVRHDARLHLPGLPILISAGLLTLALALALALRAARAPIAAISTAT
ncbi:MAG TPA: TCR/Tet family MFS transporter [Caulobacteraceae bacterium]|nr:TCR/Tet family MFS transporter [Caulobacteraceae bacterium]